MRFIVMVKANKDTEAGKLPTREVLETMGAFTEGLVRDGVMLMASGLTASSQGARISYQDGKTSVTDGPFAETKELVAGFWILQGRSKEEIVERMLSCPFADAETIEIRRLFEPEDFAGIL